MAAMLHDVGKLDLSVELIRKASSLSDEEWQQIREHPARGANMVRSIGGILRNAVPIIMAHHEQYAGTGYYRLKGEEIPMGARIIAVADTYDAMTTDRPYQKARAPWDAMDQIEKASGRQFDRQVVAAFRKVLESGEHCLAQDGSAVTARSA